MRVPKNKETMLQRSMKSRSNNIYVRKCGHFALQKRYVLYFNSLTHIKRNENAPQSHLTEMLQLNLKCLLALQFSVIFTVSCLPIRLPKPNLQCIRTFNWFAVRVGLNLIFQERWSYRISSKITAFLKEINLYSSDIAKGCVFHRRNNEPSLSIVTCSLYY